MLFSNDYEKLSNLVGGMKFSCYPHLYKLNQMYAINSFFPGQETVKLTFQCGSKENSSHTFPDDLQPINSREAQRFLRIEACLLHITKFGCVNCPTHFLIMHIAPAACFNSKYSVLPLFSCWPAVTVCESELIAALKLIYCYRHSRNSGEKVDGREIS